MFDSLPLEVIELIAWSIDIIHDLSSLSLTGRQAHSLLDGLLYSYDAIQIDSQALRWAAKQNDEIVYSKAREAGAVIHPINEADLTETDALVKNGRDLTWANALSSAAANGHEAMVDLLLNTEGMYGSMHGSEGIYSLIYQRPLLVAAQKGHNRIVERLLHTNWFDPNVISCPYGRRVLHVAAYKGHVAAIQTLLRHNGIDPNLPARQSHWTPLMVAADSLQEFSVRALLEDHRVDINAQDSTGRTALAWICDSISDNSRCRRPRALSAAQIEVLRSLDLRPRRLAVIKVLYEGGANIFTADKQGRTPLHQAVASGFIDIVSYLAAKPGACEARDNAGHTPLSYAAAYGKIEAIGVLLRHSAEDAPVKGVAWMWFKLKMDDDNNRTLESSQLYTIAWIAALSLERAVAEAMLDEQHHEPRDFTKHPTDTNIYTWGRMGVHNIVIAALPRAVYGTTSAAITAAHMASSLPHIQIAVLVGIAGGVPRIKTEVIQGESIDLIDESQDIRLGDVVVGNPDGTSGGVVQYDLGKSKPGQVWEIKGSLNSPPDIMLTALTKLESQHIKGRCKIPELLAKMGAEYPAMTTTTRSRRSMISSYSHQGVENDILFKSDYSHKGSNSDCRACEPSRQIIRPLRDSTEPHIHYGIIASGNKVIKDAVTRDEIARSIGENPLCYEMEAAGIIRQFPCLVIQGISNYADSHKNDRWQSYASATAAAFTKELFLYLPPVEITVSMPLRQIPSPVQSLLGRIPVTSERRYNVYSERINPSSVEDGRVKILGDNGT